MQYVYSHDILSQSENLQAFIMAVTNCARYVDIKYLIFAQLIIFLREP